MKKMAIKGLVTLAAVVALCMFFSGTIKTISTAKVKLVTAKQGKLEEEIKLSGNLTFPETEDVKLALASDQSVTIKRVRVAKGRRVAAGDVLFEAEVSGYDKEMESLRGEYDAAQKELMELERKNGDVRLKRTEEIWVEAYDALAKSKDDCMTAQTQLEVAAKLAGVTLSGGRLPSGETDETLTAAQKAVDAAQAAQSAPADDATAADAADDTAEDDMTMEEETVDLSGFVATEAMNRLSAEVDDAYGALCGQIKAVFPALTDDVLATLKPTITGIVAVQNDRFELQYDRALAASGMNPGLNGVILREAYTMAVSAFGLLILAAAVLFYIPLVAKMGVPRLIIGLFFILLCLLAMILGLSLPSQLSNTLVRLGMNGVLVLAMLPGIQCGISLNLGLPIGIIGGLIGGLLCIEFGMSGFTGLFFAIAVGLVIAAATGWLYGLLLNRLKGSEMSVTTYVGFSVVSLMCIAWLVLPFKSPIMKWPLGNGLRTTIGLQTSYRHVLNDFLSFEIFGVTIPTGLLLFFAACCLAVWLFMRSKTGIAMSAAGANPRFAAATGINVDRMRIIGTMLSTMLAAVGIIVYGQSYGFMQLYQAPRQMGFLAASAILIGGATTSRAKISNVVIGTFLFQGVLTLGMPVANALVPQSTISETLRILISNGIILYALTKSGGANRG